MVALDLQQAEQLVHPGRDGQLLGADPVHAMLDEQLAEPVLHRRPVALHLLLGGHLLAPEQVAHAGRLAPEGTHGTPAMLPALALSVTIMATAMTTVSNQYSRAIESRADSFALRSTDQPEPFISFERRIALRNLSDPDPPGWITFLTATHPPAVQRIGLGVAYERGPR